MLIILRVIEGYHAKTPLVVYAALMLGDRLISPRSRQVGGA